MDAPRHAAAPLFDVYLRLRPQSSNPSDKFLDLEQPSDTQHNYITIKPPASDHRKRAVERFGFTKVFEEQASQLDLFNGTSLLPLIEGVLAPEGKNGRDGLLATLGVTGSGKSHTILGSKTQRGLTQMTLDVLFKSIGNCLVHPQFILHDLAAVDVSEAQIVAGSAFLGSVYGEADSRVTSRAQTPMLVSQRASTIPKTPSSWRSRMPFAHMYSHTTTPSRSNVIPRESLQDENTIRPVTGFARITRSVAKLKQPSQKEINANPIYTYTPTAKRSALRPSALPQLPSVDDVHVAADKSSEYAIVVSMYEVYNDRIYDLLSGTPTTVKLPNKDIRRRPLLFKSTEYSPDRKVVAGLKKIVCGSLDEALLVLETGLTERRVAGTGSNATSSRSHGFFCVEVKKRDQDGTWGGNALTIVDLAGSERARTAKTAGATLAEAGKINESLMYLGQCMQMQSDNSSSTNTDPGLVPYRQCKLTELLFSNSFQHPRHNAHHCSHQSQKAIMIVTADPRGDFNATSQILRYSALAREVTVPRVPSVTSTILYPALPQQQQATAAVVNGNGRISPTNTSTAASTSNANNQTPHPDLLTRLEAELSILRLRLSEETDRRRAAEESWNQACARMDEAVEDAEAAVREECMDAFETRLQVERERWAIAAEEERVASERWWDGKVGILAKATEEVSLHDSGDDNNGEVRVWTEGLKERASALEKENEALRSQVSGLNVEMRRLRNEGASSLAAVGLRTPSRKVKVLKARPWVADAGVEGGDENALGGL